MSIKFYNDNAKIFFNNTVNANMENMYFIFELFLPSTSGEILDLGCGSGRDSKHFLSKGFDVIAIDLSPALAQKATRYIGQEVIVADMRNLDFKNKFIGIWACASLLHLSEDDIYSTIKKCHIALKENGIFYASFKYGDKNYEKDERNFTCFTEEKFLNLIENLNYKVVDTFVTEDVRPDRKNEKWFNVILKK
ncbi:class I SAM-dependent methyltransferase [Fusobacterium sp.]|uniref:class I SAM-dependent methyltransferase n=1 Tax=Fusobacterium sp. TaxID=68766 RepID=UPI00396CE12F